MGSEREVTIRVKGVGKDAEIEANARGGLQSKSPAYLHLVDPKFLTHFVTSRQNDDNVRFVQAVNYISQYMEKDNHVDYSPLIYAINVLEENGINIVMKVGEVLQYGATKSNGGKGYPTNNWRKIPRESHINHALIHLVALIAGDTQDDHVGHALCRLQMAIATKETEGFYYTKPCETIEVSK